MALTRLCTGRAGYSAGRRLLRGTSLDEAPLTTAKAPDAKTGAGSEDGEEEDEGSEASDKEDLNELLSNNESSFKSSL